MFEPVIKLSETCKVEYSISVNGASWCSWPPREGDKPLSISYKNHYSSLNDNGVANMPFASGGEFKVHFCWQQDDPSSLYVVKYHKKDSPEADIQPVDPKDTLLGKLGRLNEDGSLEKFVGDDLFDYINDNSEELTIYHYIFLAYKIAEAILEMHDFGYVHGDLKLENLAFDGTRVHILDIGEKNVHKFTSADEAAEGMLKEGGLLIPHTPAMCAPEIYPYTDEERKAERPQLSRDRALYLHSKNKFISTAADAYSLGCIVKDMLFNLPVSMRDNYRYERASLTFEQHCIRSFYRLADELCVEKHEDRLTIDKFKESLLGLLKSYETQAEKRLDNFLKSVSVSLAGIKESLNAAPAHSDEASAGVALINDYSDSSAIKETSELLSELEQSLQKGGYWQQCAFYNHRLFAASFESKITESIDKSIKKAYPVTYTLQHKTVAYAACILVLPVAAIVLTIARYMLNTALHNYFWKKHVGFEWKTKERITIFNNAVRQVNHFNSETKVFTEGQQGVK